MKKLGLLAVAGAAAILAACGDDASASSRGNLFSCNINLSVMGQSVNICGEVPQGSRNEDALRRDCFMEPEDEEEEMLGTVTAEIGTGCSTKATLTCERNGLVVYVTGDAFKAFTCEDLEEMGAFGIEVDEDDDDDGDHGANYPIDVPINPGVPNWPVEQEIQIVACKIDYTLVEGLGVCDKAILGTDEADEIMAECVSDEDFTATPMDACPAGQVLECEQNGMVTYMYGSAFVGSACEDVVEGSAVYKKTPITKAFLGKMLQK